MSNHDKLVIPDPDEGGGEGGSVARRRDEPAIDWEYIYDFRCVVDELEAAPEVVDVSWEIPDPVPKFTIDTLEHGLDLEVPRRIKQFYLVADGLRLEWSLERDGEVVPGGGFELFGFATVFDSWLDELWPNETDTEDDEDFLWALRGFARFPDPSRRDMVVVCIEDEYPTYDLFLHDPETRRSERLCLDVRTYLKVMLQTRGTYGWHHLMSESDLERDEQRRRVRHFYDVAERVFPDADLEHVPSRSELAVDFEADPASDGELASSDGTDVSRTEETSET